VNPITGREGKFDRGRALHRVYRQGVLAQIWRCRLARLAGGLVEGFLCKAGAVTLATIAPAE